MHVISSEQTGNGSVFLIEGSVGAILDRCEASGTFGPVGFGERGSLLARFEREKSNIRADV